MHDEMGSRLLKSEEKKNYNFRVVKISFLVEKNQMLFFKNLKKMIISLLNFQLTKACRVKQIRLYIFQIIEIITLIFFPNKRFVRKRDYYIYIDPLVQLGKFLFLISWSKVKLVCCSKTRRYN